MAEGNDQVKEQKPVSYVLTYNDPLYIAQIESELKAAGWYWKGIGRARVEFMFENVKDGTFIVRDSESIKGDYSLTVRYQQTNKMFHIYRIGDKIGLKGEVEYSNLIHCITYYMYFSLANYNKNIDTKLCFPYTPKVFKEVLLERLERICGHHIRLNLLLEFTRKYRQEIQYAIDNGRSKEDEEKEELEHFEKYPDGKDAEGNIQPLIKKTLEQLILEDPTLVTKINRKKTYIQLINPDFDKLKYDINDLEIKREMLIKEVEGEGIALDDYSPKLTPQVGDVSAQHLWYRRKITDELSLHFIDDCEFGSFLVRRLKNGFFILYIYRSKGKEYTFNIRKDNLGFYRLKNGFDSFPCLTSLVFYYTYHNIDFCDPYVLKDMYLTTPCFSCTLY